MSDGRGPFRMVGVELVRWLLWFVLLWCTYLVLITSVTVPEATAGGLLAAVAALLGNLTSRVLGSPPRPPRLRWLSLLWLPVELAKDTWTLLLFWLRYVGSHGQPRGTFVNVRLGAHDADDAEARRAHGVLLLSLTPSCYVVDVTQSRQGDDTLRLHRLSGPGRIDRAVL
jgi:hypothetical protein